MDRSRRGFQQALRQVNDEVLLMGSAVDKAIERSSEALKTLDQDAARQIIRDDAEINRRRFDIEERVIELMATQQPMAGDLRLLVSVLNIITDLERIGDHAEGNAKIVLLHADERLLKPLVDLPKMADKGRDMLRRSLTAFVERDAEAAKRIAAEDDEVDALYDTIYHDLLVIMARDPTTIDRATWLLWAAHNFERIADRVTNICERVVYEVSGRMQEMNVSTY